MGKAGARGCHLGPGLETRESATVEDAGLGRVIRRNRSGTRSGFGGPADSHTDLSPFLSPSVLRREPDINELNLPKTCDISFSDPDDLLNFKLVICPDEVGSTAIFQGMGVRARSPTLSEENLSCPGQT